MRTLKTTILAACFIAMALGVVASSALAMPSEFDRYALKSASATLSTTQAGAHPDVTLEFSLDSQAGEPFGLTRDLEFRLPAGLFGNPEAFPRCTTLQLGSQAAESHCPVDSQIGSTEITLGGATTGTFTDPVYNMPAPGAGKVARLGFFAGPYPMTIQISLDPSEENLISTVEGAPAAAALVAAKTTLWGVPGSPDHDSERITPAEAISGGGPPGGRSSDLPEMPFMTNPTSCMPGRQVVFSATSYQLPGAPSSMAVPFPGITGCGLVSFGPSTTARPTSTSASTGSGLEYQLSFGTKGLEFPNLIYESEVKRAEVILPEGMTINPSQAEGLGVCSEEDFARESYSSGPDEGCPQTSKIGTVTAVTPVLSEAAEGSIYVAKPYQNPFDSLIALYIVLKIPNRGVLVKLPGRVLPDPLTGRLTAIFDGIPQLPVASFDLQFHEGARAPLVTPAACGTYGVVSNFSPWANPATSTSLVSSFAINSGIDRGPCPTGGVPPFHPNLVAGSINNAAGAFSPFDIGISRTDGEQEITHFSIKLPRGVTGKLAGIPFCPEADIAAAKARERQSHGGDEEMRSPSCPAASEVGSLLIGAGVGTSLTYVPGKLYLAGPYDGDALSIVAIAAAVAGPFDLGTVVVREGLKVDPTTAQVSVDAARSDPIPHIVDGIPVHVRGIRVHVDRPNFVLNPTSCERGSTASTILGSGLDFVSEADDRPVTVTSPFQAASCASLGFRPALRLRLSGNPRRTGLPRLQAVVTARPGDANIGRAVVNLPSSELLEQRHIGTSCTRVQFDAGPGNGADCPQKSVYGHARAVTPLLEEPMEGPVYLRSNGGERKLPDLVAALHSKDIDIDLVGFIDSVHKKGSEKATIRTTFASVPDAPVTSFELDMFGGKRGLLINSTNLCKGRHRATSRFTGQNGLAFESHPAVGVQCRGSRKAGRGKSNQEGKDAR